MVTVERENSTAPGGVTARRADAPMEGDQTQARAAYEDALAAADALKQAYDDGVKTERLERYFVQAWQEMQDPDVEIDLPASIFARKGVYGQPILRSDRTNHVLTYAGAFNPPHIGHVEILADGFYNSGPGLNIVSAFVVPIGDDGIQAKEDARKGPGPAKKELVFTQKQRADLLMSHLRETNELRDLACKTKVWNLPTLDPFPGYMRRVMELAAADGFDVEFLSLKGPDHLRFDKPIKHPALLDCRKIIFSEVSRPNDDAWVNGQLRPLKGGWSSWSEISSVTGTQGVTSSVWECTLADPAGSAVRLLTHDNKADKPDISSSGIRKMILDPATRLGLEVFNQKLISSSGMRKTVIPAETLGLDVLIQELKEAGAISPEMLAEFLTEDTQ
ncbi:hypothetical protein F5883DRAFT_517941 [Diaporthe sp. PMI_573]|nr:hypothetical protein F5883DRAFT_517941 [Diaporthaceae sp. PMI_573]